MYIISLVGKYRYPPSVFFIISTLTYYYFRCIFALTSNSNYSNTYMYVCRLCVLLYLLKITTCSTCYFVFSIIEQKPRSSKRQSALATKNMVVFTWENAFVVHHRLRILQSRQKEACYRGPFVRKQTVSEPTVIGHPS